MGTHRRRRIRTTPRIAEVLEHRLCLSGVSVSVSLQNDTGQAGDNITEDPTLAGSVANVEDFNSVEVHFDYDGDGLGDDYAYIESDGSFTYNPDGFIGFGEVTIWVRAADWSDLEMEYSAWESITFTYQNPNDPPEVASLELQEDTGEAGDNITENPAITGTVSNENGFDSVELHFDFDGDGLGDDYMYPESDGSFTYNPSGFVGFGEVTIRVRVVEWDARESLYSEWSTITYTFENPNDPPEIASLTLQNDTGDPGDKVTEDPTLAGTVTNDNGFDSVELHIDFDGDGLGDDYCYVESDGTFTYDPTGFVGPGEVTVYVRVVEFGMEMLYGEWQQITFTFETDEMP